MTTSVPEMQSLGDTYLLSWKDTGIQVKLTNLIEKHEGVTAEILATKAGGHLYQARVNLLSPTAKKTLARELTTRINTVEWSALLEQAFTKVIIKYREGEPVLEFLSSDEVIKPRFLLNPILYVGMPTIIFGEKAVLKSTIALIVYICLILPWKDNPMGWEVPDESTNTLILDYEVDKDVVQYNTNQMMQGMGLPAFPVLYRRGRRPFADDIDQIKKIVMERNCKAIIIDSLGPAVGGDLKDPAVALKFTSAIRDTNCSALLIGQTSKDKEKKTSSVFGSTFFEYYARNIFELRKAQEEGSYDIDIAMYQTFCNLSRRRAPMGFHVSHANGISIESTPITMPELVERMATTTRFLHAIKGGAMTPKELVDSLGIKRSTIDTAARRLKAQSKIIKVDEKWGLRQS